MINGDHGNGVFALELVFSFADLAIELERYEYIITRCILGCEFTMRIPVPFLERAAFGRNPPGLNSLQAERSSSEFFFFFFDIVRYV
jgi:hypothetical protein